MTYVGVMNNTKWDELRLAFYAMRPPPRWRTRDVETGHISDWDREWYYHFRNEGYESIHWLEVAADTPEARDAIADILRKVHVPAESTADGLRVIGYILPGEAASYL